jgi:hypothetical protein
MNSSNSMQLLSYLACTLDPAPWLLFLLDLVDQCPHAMRDKDPKLVILLEHPSWVCFPPDSGRGTGY